MNDKSKMKIICDPYKKEIEYQWYDYNLDKYVEVDSEYSRLVSDDLVRATIQNRAYEIVNVINEECNVGNVGLEIVFVGTDSDYEDFCNVIKTYYRECNIECIKDSHYYFSADKVMQEIEDRFAKVRATFDEYTEDKIVKLVDKFIDTVRPSIALCFLGLYSAGKSAFINSIIGAEILPSASDPTTAKVYKIICAKDYRIKFQFDGKECVLTFKGEDYKPNSNFERNIIKELQKIVEAQKRHNEVYNMNAALSIINGYKDKKHQISDMIEIEIPFARTSLPVKDVEFVIYDTPGSNSKSNKKHFEILKDSLNKQTNALPVFLTTPDTMDAEDNDDILKLIDEMGTALDTTNLIMVVNKSDEKGPKTLNEKRDKLKELSITKWKSTRIFFVSSVIGIASKKDNPDDSKQWLDEDMQEIYDEKKSKYTGDERKLYEFNIVDKSKMDDFEEYRDDTVTHHLYKNSGLESVEREIAEYAQRYARYNKCNQASGYLQEAIYECVDNIQETEQQLNATLDEAKKHFDAKKNELCAGLENKKKEITVYNTEFQAGMQKAFRTYKEQKGIDEEKISAVLQKKWKEYVDRERKKEKNGALLKIQDYVQNYYNELLLEFSRIANSYIVPFWDEKSKCFKNGCIAIVRGSSALADEQKELLESIVLSKSNMDTCKMDFNLRKIGAIRHKKFLLWKLKSEKFEAGVCASNIVSQFNGLARERVNTTERNNANSFKQWTDRLISKLVGELCKFNSDLGDFEEKIERLISEIDNKNECIVMLKENQRHIEQLLDIQGGEDDE